MHVKDQIGQVEFNTNVTDGVMSMDEFRNVRKTRKKSIELRDKLQSMDPQENSSNRNDEAIEILETK